MQRNSLYKHFVFFIAVLFMVTTLSVPKVLGRKYPTFGEYETDYRRQGLSQGGGDSYYTDQQRQQEERGGGFGKNNAWPNNFGSDQFAQPFNHQNIFSSQPQLNRRFAIEENEIIENAITGDVPNYDYNDGLNVDGHHTGHD